MKNFSQFPTYKTMVRLHCCNRLKFEQAKTENISNSTGTFDGLVCVLPLPLFVVCNYILSVTILCSITTGNAKKCT